MRALKLARKGVGGVAEFVAKALTPPSDLALENALSRLIAVGALRADDEGLTPLGQHLVTLPMVSFFWHIYIFSALLQFCFAGAQIQHSRLCLAVGAWFLM